MGVEKQPVVIVSRVVCVGVAPSRRYLRIHVLLAVFLQGFLLHRTCCLIRVNTIVSDLPPRRWLDLSCVRMPGPRALVVAVVYAAGLALPAVATAERVTYVSERTQRTAEKHYYDKQRGKHIA